MHVCQYNLLSPFNPEERAGPLRGPAQMPTSVWQQKQNERV